MFGHRADGKLLKKIDPVIALTPYLMPMRCDAQVFTSIKADYEKIARYIMEQRGKGHKISFMEVVIAAYVRSISEIPELNRFVANKRLYARTQLTVSFTLLKGNAQEDDAEENTVKCFFDPRDTVFDVAERVNEAIEQNRGEEADNTFMKLARLLLNPVLANIVAGMARFLDRYGILPKFIMDASPVHTSMYITNLASIGLPLANHHIYNFGTTSQFVAMGSVVREISVGADGQAVRKRYLPLGFTVDERICSGIKYAQMMRHMLRYLDNPSLLETPPETVLFEENHTYSFPACEKKRSRRKQEPSEQK